MAADRFKERFKTSLEKVQKQLRRDSSTSSDFNYSSGSGGLHLLSPTSAAAQTNIGSELTAEDLLRPGIVRVKPENEVLEHPSDPLVDDEILEQVEERYFAADFDASRYELEKLPLTLDSHVINGDRQRLLAQLTVVTKRVFAKILEQQSKCAQEMERVRALQADLNGSLTVCGQGRAGLSKARKDFTASSLGILAAYRRRQQISLLLHYLNVVRTLQKTDERLQELLSEQYEDFPAAIQLILECEKAAVTYSRFEAVKQLSGKLRDTLEMAEERLDVALARVCTDFSPSLYSKLNSAYKLLGKTQTSMDQLTMHVTSAIHNTAWNVVYGHAALLAADNSGLLDDLARRPFPELCSLGDSGSVIPCLVDLCRALWTIMESYNRIVEWHREHDNDDEYVGKKLINGKVRIWQDVQTKTRVFVLANDLSGFTIDAFLEFLDVIRKLIDVGRTFSGDPTSGDSLQESLKRQCWAYFKAYHAARLEELSMHVENEGWAICPVKPTFKVQQLVEFRHLKSSSSNSPRKTSSANLLSPFDAMKFDDSMMEEDLMVSSNGDEAECFYSDDSDDDSNDESFHSKPLPIMTNTSLMLLRLCGKYLHLMRALKPIAASVFRAMGQLLEFYALVVHKFFAPFSSESLTNVANKDLTSLLERIEAELVRRRQLISAPNSAASTPSKATTAATITSQNAESEVDGAESASGTQSDLKGLLSSLPTSASLPGSNPKLPETLFGLAEKLASVESCLFFAAQFSSLEETIKGFLPENDGNIVDEFAEGTISVLRTRLRRPIYLSVASASVKSDVILQLMSKVAWDIKEVRSQHSQYVDVLLRDFQLFSMRLQDVRKSLPVSSEVRRELWDLCTLCAANVFVEGFSSAKRCSNEGRALMQLDFRQFVVKLEKMSEQKPLPYQDNVTKYVKAYYIPEVDLEDWVKDHNEEYSEKQLMSLVNCVAYSNNRTKQKLNGIISDLSGKLRRNDKKDF